MIDSIRFSRDVFASLSDDERTARLSELETALNAMFANATTLQEFQSILYRMIDDVLVRQLGHWLGPWEYDCEVEYWGGKSYMDKTIPDELLLRSEYPHGIRLSWGEFKFKPWS